MGTTKVLSLTVEQAADLVNEIFSEEITSVKEPQSPSFFQKVKQNLRNGMDELRNKFGKSSEAKTPEVAQVKETVRVLVKDPVEAAVNESAKKMSDHEYKCYLNSVVFGE